MQKNYKESELILEEIKKAKNILINCHRHPDPDSIGSALSMYHVLTKMGKLVTIVCPSEELDEQVNYLDGYNKIKSKTNFASFNYNNFDLFITLDSSSIDQVTTSKMSKIPISTIVIDHHATNTKYGDMNLVDDKITSTSELLFKIFEDWNRPLNKSIAECLIAGIIGDTGAFRYPGANEQTLRIASELIRLGADKDKAVHAIYRSEPFKLIKFYGEVLSRVEIDKKNKFVWSAVPFSVYKKLGKPVLAKESAASLFAQVVDGTDFGFIALETEKGKLSVSFRSRTGFDTSKLAMELNGGGHVYASGGKVEGLPFDKAVQKVLQVARKYANKNS